MKTNFILSSADRNLFGMIVKQQAKTQFLCVTDLQLAYNSARYRYGWSERRVESITSQSKPKERIYHLLRGIGLISLKESFFIEAINCIGFVNVLKQLGLWSCHEKGKRKGCLLSSFDMVFYCNRNAHFVFLRMHYNVEQVDVSAKRRWFC